MVGLVRADSPPKYAYYAYAVMTRMLEGKRWVRNDSFGPDVYACVFTDDAKKRGHDGALDRRSLLLTSASTTRKRG